MSEARRPMKEQSDAYTQNDDTDFKWLIEESHKAYLTWIASWLACLLGIISILITITSGTEILHLFSRETLVYAMIYVGLVSGMLLSVYRLSNITSEIIIWATKITSKTLRSEIFSHRGSLSKFIVDNNGRICRSNQLIVFSFHIVCSSVLIILAILPRVGM